MRTKLPRDLEKDDRLVCYTDSRLVHTVAPPLVVVSVSDDGRTIVVKGSRRDRVFIHNVDPDIPVEVV